LDPARLVPYGVYALRVTAPVASTVTCALPCTSPSVISVDPPVDFDASCTPPAE